MIKKIKKWGNSLIITFNKEEIERLELVENSWVTIYDIVKNKEVKK